MTTKTKTRPSAELTKLRKARDATYAALQGVKSDREAWEAETKSLRSEYTAFIDQHPEDWRDAARNPKPDSPSAAMAAKLKERLASDNPHEVRFDKARTKFHEADEELHRFWFERILDLIDESEPEFEALKARLPEALGVLIEFANGYAGLQARVESYAHECPGLSGQDVAIDALPQQLKVMARAALEHELTQPTLTELGRWKVEQHT